MAMSASQMLLIAVQLKFPTILRGTLHDALNVTTLPLDIFVCFYFQFIHHCEVSSLFKIHFSRFDIYPPLRADVFFTALSKRIYQLMLR